jgi:hypothetical protein
MSTNSSIEPLHFCYWLKGYTEITNAKMPTEQEWRIINDHLDAVFTKVTPTYPTLIGSGSFTSPVFSKNISVC